MQSAGPPANGWARSLRLETALQDQHRRTLHSESSGVTNSNVMGFERWNAARRLQEQMDAARGVEHAKRLAKSRSINARFNWRSTMKDLREEELQRLVGKHDFQGTAGMPSPRGTGISSPLGDDNFTRAQALKAFGIELDRIGSMTTARTSSTQRLMPEKTGGVEETSSRPASIRRTDGNSGDSERGGNTDGRRGKRDRGGSFATTGGDNQSTAAKKREMLSSKLKVLEMLISDEILRTPGDSRNASPLISDVGPETILPANSATTRGGGGDDVTDTVDHGGENVLGPRETRTVPKNDQTPAAEMSGHGVRAVQTELIEMVDTTPDVAIIEKPTTDVDERSEPRLPNEGMSPAVIGKGLPNHRPCWWCFPLLLPGAEDVSVPDTIVLARITPGIGDQDPSSKTRRTLATSDGCNDSRDIIGGTCRTSHRGRALVWISSRPEPATVTSASNVRGVGEGSGESTESSARGGVIATTDDENEEPTRSHLAVERRSGEKGAKNGARNPRPHCLPVPSVHRLHVEAVDGNEGLLCAARAVCECGRRRGGGESIEGLKLPLALLKIWGRHAEQCATVRPLAGTTRTDRGSSRGRRLRVVLLWTEHEVVEALRDMINGRWGSPCRPETSKIAVVPRPPTTGESTTTMAPTVAYAEQEPQDFGNPGASPAMGRTGTALRGQRDYLSSSGVEDTCCIQAFVKTVKFSTTPPSTPAAIKKQHALALPSGFTSLMEERSASIVCSAQPSSEDRAPKSTRVYANPSGAGTPGQSDAWISGSVGSTSRDNRRMRSANVESGDGCRSRWAAASGPNTPVFYRAVWRRTGRRVFVWKLASRYPYVSNLAAHLCPLVWAKSSVPFTATEAEEGAFATATAMIENLAKVLRRAYDPTLQRLWADWAVSEVDGQWLLIEIHGVKTDADIRIAAATKAAASVDREVKSKVFAAHNIPPSHYCGDVDDLKARLATAHPTQDMSLIEMSKRVCSASKRRPARPPTPSKVSDKSRKVLFKKGAWERENDTRNGARRMVHQYWRCAGDFCETHCRSPASNNDGGKCENVAASAARSGQLHTDGAGERRLGKQGRRRERDSRGTGEEEEQQGESCGREPEGEDDIVGGRKHALAVEVPRTVLFRLVLNARAALLGWRVSASEFALMEKPVQLCSSCYAVCYALELERIESTTRAMEAEEVAAQAMKASRNTRPPGWKSRVQHELEDSLDTDRDIVSRLMDKFAAAGGQNKRESSSAPPKSKRNSTPLVRSPTAAGETGDASPRPLENGGSGGDNKRGGGVRAASEDETSPPKSDGRGPKTVSNFVCGEKEAGQKRGGISLQDGDPSATKVRSSKTSIQRSKTSLGRPTTVVIPPLSLEPVRENAATAAFSRGGQRQRNQPQGEQERQHKREVRARRKAKERARRKLRRGSDGRDRQIPENSKEVVCGEPEGSSPQHRTSPPDLQPKSPSVRFPAEDDDRGEAATGALRGRPQHNETDEGVDVKGVETEYSNVESRDETASGDGAGRLADVEPVLPEKSLATADLGTKTYDWGQTTSEHEEAEVVVEGFDHATDSEYGDDFEDDII